MNLLKYLERVGNEKSVSLESKEKERERERKRKRKRKREREREREREKERKRRWRLQWRSSRWKARRLERVVVERQLEREVALKW